MLIILSCVALVSSCFFIPFDKCEYIYTHTDPCISLEILDWAFGKVLPDWLAKEVF